MRDELFSDDLDELETEAPMGARPRGHAVDDLDATEIGDLGVDPTASASVMPDMLLDPEKVSRELDESDDLYDEVDEAELAEADALDLEQFSRRGQRGFDADAFEEWVSISRKYGNLKPEEIDRLLRMAQGDDEEIASYAADKLVRHNVKWIVRCLRKSRLVGPSIMNYPSDLRDDMLSLGRMGFFVAIQKYDFEKALKSGAKGHRKSFLHYSAYWIDKMVGEFLNAERLGLNDDAAQDLKRVNEARAELARRLGRAPSNEEIAVHLEKKARAKLAREGEADPTMKRLRRRGALTVDRVAELSRHATRKVSVDAPVGDEPDGPGLQDYLAAEDRGAEAEAEVHAAVRQIKALLAQIPDLRKRWVFKMLHAMATDRGHGFHMAYNPPEAAIFVGRSADSIGAYEEEVRQELMGEATVRVDALGLPGSSFTLGRVMALKAVVEALELIDTTEREKRLQQACATILQTVSLRDLLREDGVVVNRPSGAAQPCPLPRHEEVVRAEGGDPVKPSFRASAEGFECKGCHKKGGDAVDWLQAMRGLSRVEALTLLGRRALETIRAEIRRAIDLAAVLRADGVAIDAERPHAAVPCPLEGATTRGRTFRLENDRFCCSACGAEGDVIEWLQRQRGLTPADALIEAAWIALDLPPTVTRETTTVVGVVDPVRRSLLQRIR